MRNIIAHVFLSFILSTTTLAKNSTHPASEDTQTYPNAALGKLLVGVSAGILIVTLFGNLEACRNNFTQDNQCAEKQQRANFIGLGLSLGAFGAGLSLIPPKSYETLTASSTTPRSPRLGLTVSVLDRKF